MYYKKIDSVKEYVFDITSLAQVWYDGEDSNKTGANGIVLKAYSDTANAYAMFSTINNKAANNNYFTPLFVIHYRDTKGLDGRWTYNSQSAGGAGTGNVNLFTGNLVFAHDDIATNGEILPLTVSHVYNTHQSAEQYEYRKDQLNSTPVYGGATVGMGFKLSIQETIAYQEIDNQDWYVYNDADGTELYFFYDSTKGKYISEDGYDLTLTISNNVYTMSDSVGNTKKFNSSGMLYEQKDLHGNKKTITYSNGRIATVTHTPAGGTAKTQLTFTYNSAGALQKITNAEDTTEYVSFEYSSTPRGTVSANNAGYLRTVTHSKGAGNCTYEYFDGGRLKYAIDSATGTKLVYQYNQTQNYSAEYAMIDSVSEYNSSGTMGQKIGFIYGAETTAVRTSGKDDAYGNSDDLLTHYVFDDQGRTISAYSTNLTKTEVYGASNAEYSPTQQGSKKNHTITKDSASGVPAINLLKNHNAESGSNWSMYNSGTGYTTTLT